VLHGATLPHRTQISFPADFPAQAPYARLSLEVDQEPEASFNHSPFGGQAGGLHGLPHQIIVNDNVCAHFFPLLLDVYMLR
jgi:hypothetical protein